MTDEQLAIGVDIGGTKLAFVLIDRAGHILAEHRLPTDPLQGEGAVIERIVAGIATLRDRAEHPIVGVGIGSPGHVDPVRGIVRNAVNLGWEAVELRKAVSAQLADELPIFMQNDGNAVALGEMYYGVAQGCSDFVYFAIGTGFGAGAIVHGEMLDGANFYALDIGHLALDPTGRLCTCGQRGCLEMYASGVGFVAGAQAYLSDYPDSVLANTDAITGSDVFSAIQAGDALALCVWDEAVEHLHQIVAICAVTLNPAMFVIGGGLGHAIADMLLPLLESELPSRALPSVYEGVQFAESQITSSAIGPACLVWHGLSRR
ncbi:MAG: hypothetical protein CUN54_00150 [Phototrophicales bacterium]|nr:MAG: hypothetical protein CUN54_00150 [Phototrophicales bacterium]